MGYGAATIHLVGGLGTKAGHSKSGGGIKKSVWDVDPTLSNYMDSNGGPKYSDASATYDNDTGIITASGSIFPTQTDALKDWIVYVEGTNFDTDRYLITASSQNTITIASGKGQGADRTVDIYVAGAFDSLQNAVDNTDASDAGSLVTIYTNKDETLDGAVGISTGGSLANNTYKRIVGFGASVDDKQQVILDATSVNYGIRFQSVANVFVENIHITKASINNWDDTPGANYNVALVNCRASQASQNGFYMYSSTYGCILIDCRADNNGYTGFFINDRQVGFVVNCLSESNGFRGFFLRDALMAYCVAAGNSCQSTRGAVDIGSSGYGGVAYSCVAYDNGVSTSNPAFSFGGQGSVAVNCIALGNEGEAFKRTGNAVLYISRCASHNNNLNYPSVYIGEGNLETDPQFADADEGDFRPRNPEVLRGGMTDTNGNATQMGAIIQAYQFARRARMVNHGRLSIIQ
jgi:parallel beta-helix repeat protein